MNEKMQRLKTREILAYAFINIAVMGTSLVGSYISGYWTDVVGMTAAVVGVIMLITRIFDGITDVIMGIIIDRTHTKYGKAKPWLLIGAVGLMICSTLIFYTPDISMGGKILYAGIMYFMVTAVFATMTSVSAPTLVNLITTDTNDRFRLGSWYFSVLFLVMMILGFALNLVLALGGGQAGYFKVALLCNGIAAVTMVFCWFNIKERHGQEKAAKTEKLSFKEVLVTIFGNKYFLLVTAMYLVTNISSGVVGGSLYYYVMYVLKNPTAFGILSMASYGACIAGTLVAPVLGKKFGVTRLVIIGNIVTAAADLAAMMNPSNLVYVVVLTAVGSFANGPACAVLSPYNAMSADYGEYKTGVARPAVYSAGTSVGTKLGAGLGGVLIAFILTKVGYNGAAEVQSAMATTGIAVATLVVPAVSMLINNLLTIPFLKFEKEYDGIREELEKRHSKTEQG